MAVGGLFQLALDLRNFTLQGLQLIHRTAQPSGQTAAYRSAESDVADDAGLAALARWLATYEGTLFARVPIAADDSPRALPEKDGVIIKNRVRNAVEAIG